MFVYIYVYSKSYDKEIGLKMYSSLFTNNSLG
jgi:hypothetical protein